MQSDPSIPDIEDLKKEFYLIVAYIRRIHKKNFDFGTIGEEGGIDGEITSRVMYPIHEIISRETTFHDVNRYGIDIGHGSGMAMLAHFNYHGKINMVGAEFNEYRANLSWNFQQILSRHEDKQMRRISKMSIFFMGMQLKFYRENLVSTLCLHFWFIGFDMVGTIKIPTKWLAF